VKDCFNFEDNLGFNIGAFNKDWKLKLFIFKYDNEIFSSDVITGSSEYDYDVSRSLFENDCVGVLRVLLINLDKERPMAERLIFRYPHDQLIVKIESDKTSYSPGSSCKLSLLVTNKNNEPQLNSSLCISVVDESVLGSLEKRLQPPRLPAVVYLESQVKELFDSHVYFAAIDALQREKSPLYIDLLLGTQGWRRFIYYNGGDDLSEDERNRIFGTGLKTKEKIRMVKNNIRVKKKKKKKKKEFEKKR